MAAYQSPVRRFSVDLLTEKENTPTKEANRLKSLLKSNASAADSTSKEIADDVKNTNRNVNDKVMVQLKDGTRVKLCQSCARSSSVQKNAEKSKNQRKSRGKNDKDPAEPKINAKKVTAKKDANSEPSAENTAAKPKRKVDKPKKSSVDDTPANGSVAEKNVRNKKIENIKKPVEKSITRTTRKSQNAENVTKNDDKNNTTKQKVPKATAKTTATDRSLRKKQDNKVNLEAEKPVKKQSRQRKRTTNDNDEEKSHEKDNSINNDSKQSDVQNDSNIINNSMMNITIRKKKKKNIDTSEQQEKSQDTLRNPNSSLSKEPNLSAIGELINNISTDNSASHSNPIDDNQNIHQNETIENNQVVQDNNLNNGGHNEWGTATNIKEKVAIRERGKKNYNDTVEKPEQNNNTIKKSKKSNESQKSSSAKTGKGNNDVSSDEPSFHNTQVHSTSLEDNANPNICVNDTIKINRTIPATSGVRKRTKKDHAAVTFAFAAPQDNSANVPESPKKQYQLVVKELKSLKRKQKDKKLPNNPEESSTSKKSRARDKAKDSSKQQKLMSSKSKKRRDKTNIKIAKAIQRMSQYYAECKMGKAIEHDLSTTESESSSSCSSCCSCTDESSSSSHCRCYQCHMLLSSTDTSSYTTTTSESSSESDTSDSESCLCLSSSSSDTSDYEISRRKSCKRYSSRRRH